MTVDRSSRVLIIACGAIAAELVRVKRMNAWEQIDIQCLPAELHNRPERIATAVEQKIRENAGDYDRILIGYADCGSGGQLDAVAEKYGAARIPGAHCYEFFSGAGRFAELSEREAGTFYLTDYLARNFERLIIRGMGIDRHPELKDMLFGNYRRLVFLAQSSDVSLDREAERAALFLELEYERIPTGLDAFRDSLEHLIR
ncbi:MAG: DUF1638 domain-containing protein [Proteobacteria bacterium]|nr:MAG: DUF1638 domain-containing protein [Pseudomonadota bacterium]